MTVILDASVAGALSLDDEAGSVAAELEERLLTAPLLVPAHWKLEVVNLLRTASRRGRIDPAGRDAALRRLDRLNVEVDRLTAEQAWTGTLRLGDRYGLTPYDAAYLELAQRRDGTLATLDRALADAARAEHIALLVAP